jgi:predicted transcriptional regulator
MASLTNATHEVMPSSSSFSLLSSSLSVPSNGWPSDIKDYIFIKRIGARSNPMSYQPKYVTSPHQMHVNDDHHRLLS